MRNALYLIGLLAILMLGGCQSTPPAGLTPEQVAMLKAQGFVWTEEGWEFGLQGKVLFETDSEQLSSDSQQLITRITRALTSVGIDDIILEGHTDDQGRPAYNEQLSQRRAQTVADAMIGNGMPEHAIQIRAMGQRKPIASNETATGRSENRRVVIIVGAP
ncbi:OmpA family protein [Pseudomonas sp. ABC1]|uniref:OmpA family protein n=1 Tax=Pseudomonas sp. ABC1 TaxID=2748080 RepID=UPI0015C3B97A|nr:OmpA family protein [Pseudomonas sp. ABC1]QLF94223.1 OmpA family protein [Pseudomonas sp. ABC1]